MERARCKKAALSQTVAAEPELIKIYIPDLPSHPSSPPFLLLSSVSQPTSILNDVVYLTHVLLILLLLLLL